MRSDVEDNGNRGGAPVFGDISPLVVAAHELKAPLSLIRQLSLSLADEGMDPSARQEIIAHMKLVSERALRLTTDLTKAHQLQPSLFEFEPVNSQQLCEEVVFELSPLYQAHGREIRVNRQHRSVLAIANKDLLRRVILNFADNALYYADERSVIELSASSRSHGEVVRVGVRDYGPAVSPDVIRSLNESDLLRPQQFNARPESSGLGLSIAKQFASAMNGTIGAVRHRDGATFYVDMQASHQLSLL